MPVLGLQVQTGYLERNEVRGTPGSVELPHASSLTLPGFILAGLLLFAGLGMLVLAQVALLVAQL